MSELRLLVLLVERLFVVSSLSHLFAFASLEDLDICEAVESVQAVDELVADLREQVISSDHANSVTELRTGCDRMMFMTSTVVSRTDALVWKSPKVIGMSPPACGGKCDRNWGEPVKSCLH